MLGKTTRRESLKMPRKLTTVEQFYIQNNRHLPASELAKQVSGVGIRGVQKYLDSLPPIVSEPAVVSETESLKKELEALKHTIESKLDPKKSVLKDKTEEEKRAIVNNEEEFRSGKLIITHQTNGDVPDGVVVMTEAATELADARKTLRVPSRKNYAKENSDKIHTIRK